MNSQPVSVDALEHDVERIRHNIGELIRELNHRRHRAFDLKLQFQQHAVRVVLIGAAVVALFAGSIVLAVARRRHRRTFRARAGRFAKALRRLIEHPEKLGAREPSVPRKVAGAGGSAMASVFGKRLAQRLVSAS
jgi:hypothetical protein